MEGTKNSIQVEVRINPRLESVVDSSATALTVGTKTYTFSKVHLTTSQMQLYSKSVWRLTEAFVRGYNCTVMAYGQTGSGKTYTMGITHEESTGIVPQALRHVFKECAEVCCSFIEVYNEEVIDLFSSHKTPLSLREVHGEITVAGVSEVVLRSYEEGVDALRRGSLERTTKSTNMNSKSSRSHAIFTLFHRSEADGLFVTSRFSFVDLAGSERLKRTLCAGDRAREGISINTGLLALGNVISALYRKSPHIPFRDSKLTRILQSCLSGYILMVACVSSSHADINETHNTLKYASRAASIEMHVKMNVQVDSSKFAVLQLKKEIQKLKTENQMLRERHRKSMHANVEELVAENRMLRVAAEGHETRRDDRREDLAQEVLKSPFVQNLIDENQRLSEEIQELRLRASEAVAFKTRIPSKEIGVSGKEEPCTRRPSASGIREGEASEEKKASPISSIARSVDSLEISNTAEVVDVPERPRLEKMHKRVVTFDLEAGTKKYALFTPRKERITMSTTVQGRLTGYLPTAFALADSALVFASIDNKVRQWREEATVLFAEDGVRCLEAADTLVYSARGLLKSFDARAGTRPLHAFRSEISALAVRDNQILTGHEDGSLSVFDVRGGALLFSEKAHSGTVFCIEKVADRIYTGSRDHTIRCYKDGFNTLSPPHLDSVQGLLAYRGDLVSLGRDCSLKRWRDGAIVKTVPYAHDSWIKCGAAMQESFVTGSKNGTLRFWDFSDNSVFCVGKLKTNGAVNAVLSSSQNAYAGCQNKEIILVRCSYDA